MPATTKADTVSADILRKIVRGELETGALLPKAELLAVEYGVNRSVVREAIKSLEVQNLVQPRKRRGTEVLDPGTSFSAEVMSAMLLPQGVEARTVDLEVLKDFLEIRAVLDTQMAAMAAENRTDEDVARLQACLEVIRSVEHEPQPYSDAITALSQAVAVATGNRIFPMLVHWHAKVQADLQELLLAVRKPGRAHLQGIEFLVGLIIAQDTAAIATLLNRFHAWAIPQLLTAAAARNGENA